MQLDLAQKAFVRLRDFAALDLVNRIKAAMAANVQKVCKTW